MSSDRFLVVGFVMYEKLNALEKGICFFFLVGDNTLVNCTGCKSKDTNAVARCFDCANFLCPNCVTAHKFMHCFEGHRVQTLADAKDTDEGKCQPVASHRNNLSRLCSIKS